MNRMILVTLVGLGITPAAHAMKVGGGLALAAGEFGGDTYGGFQLGAYAGIPAVERLSIGGDVTWYPANNVTLLAFDPNVHFNVLQLPVLDVYPIAGLNVLYARAEVLGFSSSDVEVGLLVGVGAEAKAGPLRPYVDAKVAIHATTYVALSGGLRIAF